MHLDYETRKEKRQTDVLERTVSDTQSDGSLYLKNFFTFGNRPSCSLLLANTYNISKILNILLHLHGVIETFPEIHKTEIFHFPSMYHT